MNTVNNSVDFQDNIKLRELFVQDHNGTTMAEVLLFSSHLPFFVFIDMYLEVCLINKFIILTNQSNLSSYVNKIVTFMIEFVTIVCPIILMTTILSDFLTLTFMAVIFITFIIIICSVSTPDVYVLYWKLPSYKRDFITDTMFLNKPPFITNVRSLAYIATAISILGVDFHIFPRRFAKTETYGVSVMDLGVGAFVMANAVVKKIPLKMQAQELYNTIVESLVLIVLGIIRYYGVQQLNYQEHVSEYGVHWNFFFTLAIVKFLSYLVMTVSKGHNLFFGITILIVHQYLLSSSLETYVLSNMERDNWFSANREGIVSCCGYISLYLIGVSISKFVNPVNSNNISKNKLIIFLWLLSFGVCLSCITYYLNITVCKISRRLANLSYVTWVTGFSLILLATALMLELFCICFFPVKPNLKSKLYSIITPTLLESINFNGLLFFLLANLLTGLVNMCIDTLNLNSSRSMLTLMTYMFVNCVTVFCFYLFHVKIKAW